MITQLNETIGLLLAPNPGLMTLDGTNSYILGTPGEGVVIVDPGPDDAGHVAALAASGRVELILITHDHADHTDANAALYALTGAPIRAHNPDYCRDAPPLTDGELIEAAGLAIHVLHTPGHTTDSVCFVLEGTDARPAVLTGDTILGRGTTVLVPGDNALANYLASLERLAALGSATGLPAHGATLPDLAATCTTLRTHRLERLDEIRAVLARLGADAPASAVADAVYADIDPGLRWAVEASVTTQLDYLRGPA